MKTIDQYNFAGKKALIRVDYNVPLDNNFQVTDDTRLQATIPTINKILKDGGSVILMSHLGRPKSGPSEEFSLKHLVKYLDDTFEAEVKFADDCIGEEAQRKAAALRPGEILLLENLRFTRKKKRATPRLPRSWPPSATCT
jgi:phosphoglycerate kinase